MLFPVVICENDGDGEPEGKIYNICFGDDIYFECDFLQPETEIKRTQRSVNELFGSRQQQIIEIGVIAKGKKDPKQIAAFEYGSVTYWTGNICWNTYYMQMPELLKLLNFVLTNKHVFYLSEAPKIVWEVQSAGLSITEEHLMLTDIGLQSGMCMN